MKEYPLITSSLLIFLAMVQRMVIENDGLSHLDLLLQKSLQYKHHKENYLYSLQHRIIPSGLTINKKPAFTPVSNDFTKRWNNILRSAEEKLVNLLLSESDNVIDDLQTKIKEGLQNNYGNDVEESFRKLEKKHQEYKNKLTRKRDKKWKTLEKNREIFMSTNIEVQREKAEVCNNLDKEELLTNKNKKQISEEFITDNRHERRKRKIRKEQINDSSHQKCELHIKSPENAFLHQPSKSYADIAREGKSTSLGNLNIRDIYLDLMNGESNNLSSTEITPPRLSTNSAEMQNSSNSLENSTSDSLGLTSQDRELISILDELQNISVTGPSNNTNSTRLTDYFCPETILNYGNRALSDAGIKILEKGLDYAPKQNKINEAELSNDFNEFCRGMRLKWYFHRDVMLNFSEVPALDLNPRGIHLKVILIWRSF